MSCLCLHLVTDSLLDHRDGNVAVMVVHAPGCGLSDWFSNKSVKILLFFLAGRGGSSL